MRRERARLAALERGLWLRELRAVGRAVEESEAADGIALGALPGGPSAYDDWGELVRWALRLGIPAAEAVNAQAVWPHPATGREVARLLARIVPEPKSPR